MYRKTSVSHVLAVALLLVLIFDPLSVLSVGFWLSFSAVAVIFYALSMSIGNNSVPRQWLRVQLAVYLGLAPLLALWFGRIPVFSIIANCVAIPWVSFVTLPLVLSGVLLVYLHESVAYVMFDMATQSLQLIWIILEGLARPDILVFPILRPSVLWTCLAIIGSALILLPTGIPGRGVGIMWFLPLFFQVVTRCKKGNSI